MCTAGPGEVESGKYRKLWGPPLHCSAGGEGGGPFRMEKLKSHMTYVPSHFKCPQELARNTAKNWLHIFISLFLSHLPIQFCSLLGCVLEIAPWRTKFLCLLFSIDPMVETGTTGKKLIYKEKSQGE